MNLIPGLRIFSYYLELFLALSIFMAYIKKRNLFLLRAAAGLFVMYLCSVFIQPFLAGDSLMSSQGWFFFYILMLIVMEKYCCEVSWTDAIYGASCAMATQHFASSLNILSWYRIGTPNWQRFSYFFIFLLVYVLFFILFSKQLTQQGTYQSSWNTALTMFVSMYAITMILGSISKEAADYAAAGAKNTGYVTLFRCCLIYAAITCFVVLWQQRLQKAELKLSRELERKEWIWQQRQIQYQTSKENIELINRKCHDLRHQVAALLQSDQMSERKESFAKEVEELVEVYDSGADTGNEALNTLLMDKGLYCRMHQIQWTCVADGTLLNFMDVVDLYTLLGNALDNAIESLEKIEDPQKRVLSVRVLQKNSFVIIQVENYFEGDLTIKDGVPQTSKSDQDYHGFGLKSMRSIAEKYQGTLSVKAEEGVFLLYVVFPVGLRR